MLFRGSKDAIQSNLVFNVFLSFASIFGFFAPFLVYESSPLIYAAFAPIFHRQLLLFPNANHQFDRTLFSGAPTSSRRCAQSCPSSRPTSTRASAVASASLAAASCTRVRPTLPPSPPSRPAPTSSTSCARRRPVRDGIHQYFTNISTIFLSFF
jgi:hypothetical protein